MNKNILKLVDKVRFVSEPEYPDQDIIFERFAELIIRECLNIMKNCNGDLGFAITRTKKRFGIEE